ncbi:MAG: alpha-glucan family phosphorylase [Candidatus Micrarchaeota archaeon]|nr:alpha-glucan family phosphorylase [Candidatus Micrarchaeota archaeon]
MKKNSARIAYFTMEIGLINDMPSYSGGLGILAGDYVKSAADMGIEMICVTMMHDLGYFYQRFAEDGTQIELPYEWRKDLFLKPLKKHVFIELEGRTVKVTAWQYDVKGINGQVVPVIFLDTDLEGNSEYDRSLSDFLYGGDHKYRLCQEVVLGIGGIRMLEKLGHSEIEKYHLNEGHCSLLIAELLNNANGNKTERKEEVRNKCIFTTHTPIAAGHDIFPAEMVYAIVTEEYEDLFDYVKENKTFNTTHFALEHSFYSNGVSKKHGEIARAMFPKYDIRSITNGVHSQTWTCEPMQKLFDLRIPGWRDDPFILRSAIAIPRQEIWDAHLIAKKKLFDTIKQQTNEEFDTDIFTLGFARRATGYKRLDLLFYDVERLKSIAEKKGKIQLVFAGKAHPKDIQGKELIKKVFSLKNQLGPNIKLVYLSNYDMNLALQMVSGCDVWLNTPMRPLEASGTSGMKAAHNGVPSLSVLDGWWLEGCVENVTGWAIGPKHITGDYKEGTVEQINKNDANDLYNKLENVVLPTYYKDYVAWTNIMRNTIAINASFFNTHRMLSEYVVNAYFKENEK